VQLQQEIDAVRQTKLRREQLKQQTRQRQNVLPNDDRDDDDEKKQSPARGHRQPSPNLSHDFAYEARPFRTSPIGAKSSIYIDRALTKRWMNGVAPPFPNEAMFYFWLDHTTALQMVQGLSRRFVVKMTRKFRVAVINFELRDAQSGDELYGVVVCANEETDGGAHSHSQNHNHSHGGAKKKRKNGAKYPYRLKALCSRQQIWTQFGIHAKSLPTGSRANVDFRAKLKLKRTVRVSDLETIIWSNIKLFKNWSNQSANANVCHSENLRREHSPHLKDSPTSMALSPSMLSEYSKLALERETRVIPIVVIDRLHSYFNIEWVLIVAVLHCDSDIGISFRFDTKNDGFAATAIYLDKGEVASKHRIVGLAEDYCAALRPFALRKFRFVSEFELETNAERAALRAQKAQTSILDIDGADSERAKNEDLDDDADEQKRRGDVVYREMVHCKELFAAQLSEENNEVNECRSVVDENSTVSAHQLIGEITEMQKEQQQLVMQIQQMCYQQQMAQRMPTMSPHVHSQPPPALQGNFSDPTQSFVRGAMSPRRDQQAQQQIHLEATQIRGQCQ